MKCKTGILPVVNADKNICVTGNRQLIPSHLLNHNGTIEDLSFGEHLSLGASIKTIGSRRLSLPKPPTAQTNLSRLPVSGFDRLSLRLPRRLHKFAPKLRCSLSFESDRICSGFLLYCGHRIYRNGATD